MATSKENDKNRAFSSLLQENDKGYKISLFVNRNKALQYQCSFCDQICNNAVELFCSECNVSDYKNNDDNEDEQFYCEICLREWLSLNNTKCPLNQNHVGAVYNTSNYIRKRINNLITICPHSDYSQNNDVDEGVNVNITNNVNSCCDWRGKLFQLLFHIENACKFAKQEYCQYYQFGCNFVGNKEILNVHNEQSVVYHMNLMQCKFSQLKQDKNALHKIVSDQTNTIVNVEKQNIERMKSLEKSNIKLHAIVNKQNQSIQLMTTKMSEYQALSNKIDAIQTQNTNSHDILLQHLLAQQNKSIIAISENLQKQIPSYVKKVEIEYHPQKTEWYHPKDVKIDTKKHRLKNIYGRHTGNFQQGDPTGYHVTGKWTCCGNQQRNSEGCKKFHGCCNNVVVSNGSDGCYRYYPCCNVDAPKPVTWKKIKNENWHGDNSIGCQQRHKCCKQNFPDSKGCETRIQLEMYYHLQEPITFHTTKPLIHRSNKKAEKHPKEWRSVSNYNQNEGRWLCCDNTQYSAPSCVMKCCNQRENCGCLSKHKSGDTEKYHPKNWENGRWKCCHSSNYQYKGCQTRYKCCKSADNGCIKFGYYKCCNVLDEIGTEKKMDDKFFEVVKQTEQKNDGSIRPRQCDSFRRRGDDSIKSVLFGYNQYYNENKEKVQKQKSNAVWLVSSGCIKKYECCGGKYPSSKGCQKIIITNQ